MQGSVTGQSHIKKNKLVPSIHFYGAEAGRVGGADGPKRKAERIEPLTSGTAEGQRRSHTGGWSLWPRREGQGQAKHKAY